MNNTPKGQIYDKLSVIITIIYLFLPCQRGKDVGRIIMESLQSRCNGRTKPCSRMNEFGQLIYLSIYLISCKQKTLMGRRFNVFWTFLC